MTLYGAIEKNAAMWDKLLTKGLLGSESMGRLAKGIPSHLGQLTTNKSMVGMLNGIGNNAAPFANIFKGGLLNRLRSQMGWNRPSIGLPLGEKMQFLSQTHELQNYVGRFNGGTRPFKPIMMPMDGSKVFKNNAASLGGKVDGVYSPSYNGISATDKTTFRHELGHFFTHQGMTPAKSLMLRQRILEKAKQHYPELIPPGLQVDKAIMAEGKAPAILEEASAQAIAASGKSRAAQQFRQHFNQIQNTRPQDIELIERANKIDPSGQHAAVINHLLHNYGLNQAITR